MTFFFPPDNLHRAAPEETRITLLKAEPYPDGQRVRVSLEITPFQQRPYIEMLLTDSNGDEVASTTIVEPMAWNLELTLHLRGAKPGLFTLEARLFYPDGPRAAPVTHTFHVPPENG